MAQNLQANKKNIIFVIDMKRNDDDIQFGNLLKDSLPEAGRSEWFTRKVLNRLPEKHKTYHWLEYLIFTLCLAICGVCWMVFIYNQNFSVITVRDIIFATTLLAVTVTLLFQFIHRVLSSC